MSQKSTTEFIQSPIKERKELKEKEFKKKIPKCDKKLLASATGLKQQLGGCASLPRQEKWQLALSRLPVISGYRIVNIAFGCDKLSLATTCTGGSAKMSSNEPRAWGWGRTLNCGPFSKVFPGAHPAPPVPVRSEARGVWARHVGARRHFPGGSHWISTLFGTFWGDVKP